MKYNPIEIALIIGSCHTREEVWEACSRFCYLILNAGQKHMYLISKLAKKREQQLNEKLN
ncbi:hypothetical protein [Salinimicrobium sp. WS361]|uniref:hypothetical protein n=1 Tax=Salinimicrobium sp. WS361 TaxID=3425123 RepID=UPI003D701810